MSRQSIELITITSCLFTSCSGNCLLPSCVPSCQKCEAAIDKTCVCSKTASHLTNNTGIFCLPSGNAEVKSVECLPPSYANDDDPRR